MANTLINISTNGVTTLATAGMYCDRNIDVSVNVLETYIVPDYWKSYLQSKAAEINAALSAAGEKKSAFLWYTDAHWKTNYGQSPMILRYLSRHTGMTKTYFGGDIAVDASGETDLLTAWLESVSEIPNHRSMIGNHDNNYSTDFPTDAERAEFFLQTNRTSDMAFGTDSTNGKMYYYVDDFIEQTRYIILSTGRMWTNADEVQWCVDVLNSTPNGWHIIAMSHLWLNNNYDVTPVVPLETPERYAQVFLDLFDAYNYRESGTTEFASTAYDFTNGKAKVEFVIGGHIHQDYDFTTATGIPVILTECDAWQERDAVSAATQGTTTENCVYAVVADYKAKKVNIISVGRGDTRSVKIPDVVTYTNQLAKSLTLDGSGIFGEDYNGDGTPDGYKRDTRTSSSGDTAATGWCVTGLIPAKVGDVLRFKNMEYYDISGDGGSTPRTTFFYYDASFNKITNTSHNPSSPPAESFNPVYGENGDVIQLTVPTGISSSIAYIRLCCGDLNENSIITVNEEITDDTTEEPETTYANLLPTAIGFDGAVLNAATTPGYAANSRYSTSSNAISSLTGTYVTGLMPCTLTSTIHLRNISTEQANNYDGVYCFDTNDVDGDGKWYVTKYTFSEMPSHEAFNTVVDENGTLIQFTLPGWISAQTHFAIGSQSIGADSIITVDEEVTYTNVLPTALDADMTSVYNGIGYKPDTRLSVSSITSGTGDFSERTEAGWCATGLIKATKGDVIRLKNCTFTASTTASTHRGGVYAADENGKYIYGKSSMINDANGIGTAGSVWSPVFDETGDNVIQFTLASHISGTYIRIVAQEFNENSIITVNEEIN